MHHQQNSPLVLCDACPRSYHAMCLELDFHQLPEEGEWACPKCIEKETKQARREGRTIGWVRSHPPTAALHDTPGCCIGALHLDVSVRRCSLHLRCAIESMESLSWHVQLC